LFAPEYFECASQIKRIEGLGRDVYEEEQEKGRRNVMHIARFANLFAINRLEFVHFPVRIMSLRDLCLQNSNLSACLEMQSFRLSFPIAANGNDGDLGDSTRSNETTVRQVQ
jgi:hypothetical protein